MKNRKLDKSLREKMQMMDIDSIFSGVYEDFFGIHTGEQFNKTATYLGLLGLGPVMEYEVKNVFMENLSFSFRFNPEFTHMGEWILGSIVPYPGYWLNCLVSLKYDIVKKML